MGDGDFGHQQQDERQRMRLANFVYLRPRLRVLRAIQQLRTVNHWSPRMELRLLERVIEERSTMVQRVAQHPLETRVCERERMVVRMTAAHVRTEEAKPAAAPAQGLRGATQNLPPMRAISRLPDMKFHRAPELRASSSTERDANLPRLPQRAPTAPQVDVNHLTDQVMRQMDRKLQAHRERMWRK